MRQIYTLALLSAIAFAQSQNKAAKEEKEFMDFAAKNNKSYKDASEMSKRKANFKGSQWKVSNLNSTGSFAVFDVNYTADLDDTEYKNMLGLSIDPTQVRKLDDIVDFQDESRGRHLQSTDIDWSVRGRGNCAPVKNQGSCGSCYAFAAIETIECMTSISRTKTTGAFVAPVPLSIQQSVDCTTGTTANITKFGTNYGNKGCNGGWMTNVWNFTKTWGVMPEGTYPYTATYADNTCKHDATKIVVKSAIYGSVTAANALTRLQSGPLSIALAAGNDVFRFYKSGVLTSANGCPTTYDHGVLLVGYGVQNIAQTNFGIKSTTKRWASTAEIALKKCVNLAEVYTETTVTSTTVPAVTTVNKQCILDKAAVAVSSVRDLGVWTIQNSWGSAWGDGGFVRFAKEDTGLGVCGMNQALLWTDVL